jgi:hypothetical protein
MKIRDGSSIRIMEKAIGLFCHRPANAGVRQGEAVERCSTVRDPSRATPSLFRPHRSPMKRDGIPGFGVGGLKFKTLNRLFSKMIQLIVARTSP